MSVLEAVTGTLRHSQSKSHAYAASPITGRFVRDNVYCDLEYHVPCSDRPLSELGETCRNAYYVDGYHVIICTTRVCVVSPGNRSFYFPPMASPIIDVTFECLEDRADGALVLLGIAVQAGVFWFVVALSSAPQVLKRGFLEVPHDLAKMHCLCGCYYAMCGPGGEVSAVEVRGADADETLDITFTNRTAADSPWVKKIFGLVRSGKHIQSTTLRCTIPEEGNLHHPLLVLREGGNMELWLINPVSKCLQKSASGHTKHLQRMKGASPIQVVPIAVTTPLVTECVVAVLMAERDAIALSIRRLCHAHAAEYELVFPQHTPWWTIPPSLSLASRGGAAAVEDTVLLCDAAGRSVSVLCLDCDEFRASERQSILTTLNVDSGVVAMHPMGDRKGRFVLYHHNGRVSYVNRFSNGEALSRFYAENNGGALFRFACSPSPFSAVSFFDGLYHGMPRRTISTEAWNNLMCPVRPPVAVDDDNSNNDAVPSSLVVWRLSSGAIGCVHYLGTLAQKLFHYSLFRVTASLNRDVSAAVQQHLLDAYQLIRRVLGEEGWLEEDDPGLVAPVPSVQWRGDEFTGAVYHARDAIRVQAHFLSLLLHMVFRFLGSSGISLLRADWCGKTFSPLRMLGLREEECEGWWDLLLHPRLADYETECCLDLVQNLRQRVAGMARRPEEDATEAQGEGESPASPLQLSSRIRDFTVYLSDKSKLLVKVCLLVVERKYNEALGVAVDQLESILRFNLWEPVTTLMEEECPASLFPLITLLTHRWSRVTSELEENTANAEAARAEVAALMEKALEKQTECSLAKALVVALSMQLPSLEGEAWWAYVKQQSLHYRVVQWIERHSLLDWRMKCFVDALASSRSVWKFYLSRDKGGRFPASPPQRLLLGEGQDVLLTPPLSLTSYFLRYSLKEVKRKYEEAIKGYVALGSCEDPIELDARLILFRRALQLVGQVDQNEEDEWQSLVEAEYLLLLQAKLLNRVDKYRKDERSGAAAAFFTSSSLERDAQLLQFSLLQESSLYELSKRYRSLGGASMEIDLLKLHSDSPLLALEEAMRNLLSFLHTVGQLDPVSAVRRLLQDPNFLKRFEAPFPIVPVIEFLLMDQEQHGGPLSISSVCEVLMECSIHPVFLFPRLLQWLWQCWEERSEGGVGVSWRGRVPHEDFVKALRLCLDGMSSDEKKEWEPHLGECLAAMQVSPSVGGAEGE